MSLKNFNDPILLIRNNSSSDVPILLVHNDSSLERVVILADTILPFPSVQQAEGDFTHLDFFEFKTLLFSDMMGA